MSRILHAAGGATSVGAAAYYAHILQWPFGLPASYFHVAAPLAGYAGYEIGRQLAKTHYRPALLAVFSLILSPLSFFSYDFVMHSGDLSFLNSFLIYLFYSLTIFLAAAGFGILELKVEDLLK